MKRILLIVFSLTTLSVAAVWFWFIQPLSPGDIPSPVTSAENAIAVEGTIAMASIDMAWIHRIDRTLNGKDDPNPLLIPAEDNSLLGRLKKQGINAIEQTDYVLAAMGAGTRRADYTAVLYGDYSIDVIKQELKTQYEINDETGDYWLFTEKPGQPHEADPCAKPKKAKAPAKPKQFAIHILKDRIIISTPELIPTILRRIGENAEAEVSLKKWRAFRQDKVVAGALLAPGDAKKGAVDFQSAMLLNSVAEQPLTGIYAGASVSMLPPQGLSLIIDAQASDSAWPAKIKGDYDSWASGAANSLKDMPSVASLMQSLSVIAKGKTLHMKATADTVALGNLEKIPGEFMQMLFSGMGSKQPVNTKISAEQIIPDGEIPGFKPRFSITSIKPYDSKGAFFKPDTITGPFGVTLQKTGLLPTDDTVIELTVKTEGKGLENFPTISMHGNDTSPSARISVSSVSDPEGNNLLREEQCGKDRNLSNKKLQISPDKVYENKQWITKSLKAWGDKSVRLQPNTRLSQIAKINGTISIDVATETKTVSVTPPLRNQVIETDDVRLYFKESGGSEIKYEVSGNMDRILAMHAKNAKNQYLGSNGSSSFGGTDTKKTITTNVKGKIASVEIVYALSAETVNYPFELNKIAPLKYGKASTEKKLPTKTISKKQFLKKYRVYKYVKPCQGKQAADLGAFKLCLNKFGERWGRETGGEFSLLAPPENALRNNFNSAEISIESLVSENGTSIPFNEKVSANFQYAYDSNYDKKSRRSVKTNERLYDNYVRIYSDNKELIGKKAKSVKGALAIRLPQNQKSFTLKAENLGEAKTSKNGIVAKIAGYDEWNTHIDLQGPVETIIQIRARSENGDILSTTNNRITEKQITTWNMSEDEKAKIAASPKTWDGMITIYGKPETIEIVYSTKVKKIKYPFSFKLK